VPAEFLAVHFTVAEFVAAVRDRLGAVHEKTITA
jgi:hypothetical protein